MTVSTHGQSGTTPAEAGAGGKAPARAGIVPATPILVATVANLNLSVAAVGPLCAGLLMSQFWWGSVFLLTLPLAVVAVVLAAWLVPAHVIPKHDAEKRLLAKSHAEDQRSAAPTGAAGAQTA